MDLLADKTDMNIFCKNNTSMMLGPNVPGTWIKDVYENIHQSVLSGTSTSLNETEHIDFCRNQMMWKSSVKTKQEAAFIFKIMNQNGIRFVFINNTLIKDEKWDWIDLDNRSLEIDLQLSTTLNLSSSGKKCND